MQSDRDQPTTLRATVQGRRGAADSRLAGPTLVLRAATPDDEAELGSILAEPEVARWWGRDAERELAELLGPDGDAHTAVFVATREGRVVGLLYGPEESDPGYRHASVDITLRTAAHGQGMGREAVALLAGWLIDVRGHHRLTIDPAVDNARAIACYRAVGFVPVGVMRAYERRADGRWHDGLLMDLLAHELVRPDRLGRAAADTVSPGDRDGQVASYDPPTTLRPDGPTSA